MLKSLDGLPVISTGRPMNVKQTAQRSHDFEAEADEALQAARDMPPGPERIEAYFVNPRRNNLRRDDNLNLQFERDDQSGSPRRSRFLT